MAGIPEEYFRSPIKFHPLIMPKIWGGDKLHRILNKPAIEQPAGESWEVSDNDSGQTIVSEGPAKGKSLRELFNENKTALAGTRFAGADHFPLLYKFIDARENLSVQVHPGDNSPLGDAKTETWMVVDAPEGSELIVGLTPEAASLSKPELMNLLKSNSSEKALNRIPVKTGDTLFIPAGTVHAITAGLLIYEVQQNSDTTFRIYDYGRIENGKPRQLHLEESQQVIDVCARNYKTNPLSISSSVYLQEFLVACNYFTLIRCSRFRDEVVLPERDGFRVFSCLKEEMTISSNSGKIILKAGETGLIPAACKKVTLSASSENCVGILSFCPEVGPEILQPLKKAGFNNQQIQSLGLNAGSLVF